MKFLPKWQGVKICSQNKKKLYDVSGGNLNVYREIA